MPDIAVYADWEGLAQPRRLGWLHARAAGGHEVFEFEFDGNALADPLISKLHLDPRIGAFAGPQYPAQGQQTFGAFADASPDRWGRQLMKRRLEREKRAGTVARTARLQESDYLLGVHDAYRVGALRFRRDDSGPFLDDQDGIAAPPFVRLRELEAASRALERDEKNDAAAGDKWLRMLIAPGGSLGGARPKASVIDEYGNLWIAKFPSVNDEYNVGAWELLVQTLARGCGLNVPESIAKRYASRQETFIVKRFDRTPEGRRLHFASAMTLTGHQDGDDASTGVSYLEIAQVLMNHGANTNADLKELWSRIVFNMLVSNTDDHLRNHGFILVPGKGWRLSEAYDMNPVPDAGGLRLNVSDADNALDLELARSVAHYFRVDKEDAQDIIGRCQGVVAQWRNIAKDIGISAREQEQMAASFRLAAA